MDTRWLLLLLPSFPLLVVMITPGTREEEEEDRHRHFRDNPHRLVFAVREQEQEQDASYSRMPASWRLRLA